MRGDGLPRARSRRLGASSSMARSSWQAAQNSLVWGMTAPGQARSPAVRSYGMWAGRLGTGHGSWLAWFTMASLSSTPEPF